MSSDPVTVALRLYVSDGGPHAGVARSNLERLLERVGVRFDVETVDISEDPATAEREGVLVTPTLERLRPPPRLRVAGDLTDLEMALDGLGLRIWALTANSGSDDQEPA